MKTFHEFFKEQTGKNYPTPEDEDWYMRVERVVEAIAAVIPDYLDYVAKEISER